jgi:hypothetical protein
MSASTQRLFHVIVIGGIGLAELAGCGGETSSSTGTGGAGGASVGSGGAAGFPMEGVTTATTTTVGAGGSVQTDAGDGSGGAPPDAHREVGGGGFAGFPMEGPNPCGTIPPQPQCADARDRYAPDEGSDSHDAADAAVDVGRDSFPLEGPPPPPPNDI